MVVPYPPGGGTDGLPHHRRAACRQARAADHRAEYRRRLEHRGLRDGRRADPDGYTILFNASLFVLGKTIMPSCPYDPQTDFRPIAQAGEAPLVLLVNLNVPGTDYASTMAAIAKEPKKYRPVGGWSAFVRDR